VSARPGAADTPAVASSSHLAADARVDGARLAGLRAAYGDLAAQLVDVFESTVADTLAGLRRAVAAADEDEARRLAHRLKGGCRNVGAGGLADVALAVERGELDATAGAERIAAAAADACAALRAAIA
jgi:HPt (histidine-containing phosphotransfer) domain-containing protein